MDKERERESAKRFKRSSTRIYISESHTLTVYWFTMTQIINYKVKLNSFTTQANRRLNQKKTNTNNGEHSKLKKD
jgi:hypothetical protein